MNRILLADDSAHAQRMGERILREEGFEVVSLTNGDTVLMRLADADPDVVIADVFLPGKSGFDICRHVKSHARHKHVRVILTAGMLEPFDEEEATRAGCDGILKKPFEASLLVRTIKPLVAEAQMARGLFAGEEEKVPKPKKSPEPKAAAAAAPTGATLSAAVLTAPEVSPKPAPPPPAAVAPPEPPPAEPAIDAEQVRAAVTLALDQALPVLIDEITERVLIALGH